MDNLSRRLILVNRLDSAQAVWWAGMWRKKGFENWADARGWLWDDYRAQVSKTKDGFVIRFLYDDDATLFRLTWL